MSELVVNLSGVNFHALMLVKEGMPKITHKNLIVLNVELTFPRVPRGASAFLCPMLTDVEPSVCYRRA